MSLESKYQVLFYTPDRHVAYNPTTPDLRGVGGGITARLRMARALARAGHEVTLMANVDRKGELGGVRCLSLDDDPPADVDILVLGTTGDKLSLESAANLAVRAKLTVVAVGGAPRPKGLDVVPFDSLYVVSNFIRAIAVDVWGVPSSKLFTAYNGVEEVLFAATEVERASRDPFRIAYLGHPQKGLDAALNVLRRLRQSEPRYSLHLFGGPELWGQAPRGVVEAGVVDHGLVGQAQLCTELAQCSFALHLQAMEEAFGIAMAESMRAGCLVLASPVGAFPEILRHGEDSFLVPGDHLSDEVAEQAAGWIRWLAEHPGYAAYVRDQARKIPWTWDRMARVWAGHWHWKLEAAIDPEPSPAARCPRCDGRLLLLADGAHCLGCGQYFRGLP